MINVEEKKRQIISFLNQNGPSLPIRIAKAIEMEHVFASAILSELLNEKKVEMSHLRVGASALYMIKGQEKKLEEYVDNLKPLEKEVFMKLKERKILYDEKEDPAVRVALRNLKDFAIPFSHEEKILWKYALMPEEETNEILRPKKEIVKIQEKEELEEVPKAWKVKKEEINQIKKKILKEKNVEQPQELKVETEFAKEVKEFLNKKEISIIEEIENSKKEIIAKISLKTSLGKFTMLLIARNKKSVSPEEIENALQRAIYEKMSCLYLIRKDPSKKIKTILQENPLIILEVMPDNLQLSKP